MHSASSRFNSIFMFSLTVLAIMCGINFFHGYYLYQPKPDVNFTITSIPNFMNTKLWDQLSFRYNL